MAASIFQQFGKCSSSEVISSTSEIIRKRKSVFDKISLLKNSPAKLSYANVLRPMCESDREYETNKRVIIFHQMVNPDKVTREASTECGKKLAEFDIDIEMRSDIYDILVDYRKTADTEKLPLELKRYLDKQIKIRKRNGVHLASSVQVEVKEIKNKISNLCIDFTRNLNEENTLLEFTREQLDGLPEEFLSSLDRNELGRFVATLKYPHYFPLMKKCKVPETRAILEENFLARCKESNTPILEELVKLRSNQAVLLQYSNHAAYILEMRMAETPEIVERFLNHLSSKIQELKCKELDTLLKYKSKECIELSIENDGVINPYDIRYYMTMVEEVEYNINQDQLREYFTMEVVTKGLLEIYQNLLELTFTQHLPETECGKDVGLSLWHEEVKLYEVKDTKSGDVLGYFYLDLYPREGKYGHACIEPLQFGCNILNDDITNIAGHRQIAIAAMVANFSKPTKERPSLLYHNEVETYFHEFGHLMHHICSKTYLSYFSGTQTQRDFIECPSQMLENWCWEVESLRMMSAHYENGAEIPKPMLDALLASRRANAGLFYARQLTFGIFDQKIHTVNSDQTVGLDIVKEYANVCEEIFGIKPTPGTSFPATFGHLADVNCGYDAAYYGYLWSEVFSMDIFISRFKAEGILNPETGRDYRRHILEPGGSMDGDDMLKAFLGRKPNNHAFLSSLGVQ